MDEYSDRTKEEDEDVLLSAAIEGMFLNSELFDHQRGASNKGYKKIDMGTLILSTQNLHLGNANVNLRFNHGMVSPAYKTYHIHDCSIELIAEWVKSEKAKRFFYDATTVGASVCRRNVEWDTLYDQPLYLPSEAEQERLATFLTTLSARIKKQTELVEHLKKYKRGVLEQFIATFQSNNASFVSLKEITQIYDGTHQTPNYQTHGVKFVSVENIESLLDTRKYISKEDFEKEFKISPSKGDVLMTRIGDIGRSSYVDFDTPIAFYVSLALFKCKNQLDGRYLAHYIMSNAFQEQLWKRTLHIAFPKKINTCEIGECEILLPSLDDQRHCAKLLDSIDLLINKNQKILEYLTTQRLGILQQIFI